MADPKPDQKCEVVVKAGNNTVTWHGTKADLSILRIGDDLVIVIPAGALTKEQG